MGQFRMQTNTRQSDWHNLVGTRPLLALPNFIFNFLTIAECCITTPGLDF